MKTVNYRISNASFLTSLTCCNLISDHANPTFYIATFHGEKKTKNQPTILGISKRVKVPNIGVPCPLSAQHTPHPKKCFVYISFVVEPYSLHSYRKLDSVTTTTLQQTSSGCHFCTRLNTSTVSVQTQRTATVSWEEINARNKTQNEVHGYYLVGKNTKQYTRTETFQTVNVNTQRSAGIMERNRSKKCTPQTRQVQHFYKRFPLSRLRLGVWQRERSWSRNIAVQLRESCAKVLASLSRPDPIIGLFSGTKMSR